MSQSRFSRAVGPLCDPLTLIELRGIEGRDCLTFTKFPPASNFSLLPNTHNPDRSGYFFFLPFFLEVFLDFFLPLGFLGSFFLTGFLRFLPDFALAFFSDLAFVLTPFFFGFDFEAFFFDLIAGAFFFAFEVSCFAAVMVAFALTGPKPETDPKDATVLAAIFSADVNPLALSVSAVESPTPGISVTGVGIDGLGVKVNFITAF